MREKNDISNERIIEGYDKSQQPDGKTLPATTTGIGASGRTDRTSDGESGERGIKGSQGTIDGASGDIRTAIGTKPPDPPKRTRGRPKGSSTNNGNSGNETFDQPGKTQEKTIIDLSVLDTTQEEKPKRRGRRKTQKGLEETKDAVLMLSMVFDGIMITTYGQKACFNELEKSFIVEPLARIINRLTPGSTEFLEKWTDPILVIIGLSMYGYRVTRKEENAKPKNERKRETVEEYSQDKEDDFNRNGASPSSELLSILGGDL